MGRHEYVDYKWIFFLLTEYHFKGNQPLKSFSIGIKFWIIKQFFLMLSQLYFITKKYFQAQIPRTRIIKMQESIWENSHEKTNRVNSVKIGYLDIFLYQKYI